MSKTAEETGPERPVVVWADGRTPTNLCKAVKKNGEPCKRPPIQGATVCRAHGGASPQVKRKAQQRLLDGVPEMIKKLRSLTEEENVPANVRLAAIRDWLDRAGITGKIEIEVSSSSFEEMVAGAIASIEDGAMLANGTDYSDRMDVVAGELVDPHHMDDDRARLPQPPLPTSPYRDRRA